MALPASSPLTSGGRPRRNTLGGLIDAAQNGDPGRRLQYCCHSSRRGTQALLDGVVAPRCGANRRLAQPSRGYRCGDNQAVVPARHSPRRRMHCPARLQIVTLTPRSEKAPEPKAAHHLATRRRGLPPTTPPQRRRTRPERQPRRTRRTAPRAAICSRLATPPQRAAGIAPIPAASLRVCGTPSRDSPASVARRSRKAQAPPRRAVKVLRAVRVPAAPARAVALEASSTTPQLIERSAPFPPGRGPISMQSLLRLLGPDAGVADDSDRHRARQADVLHPRTGRDDRRVLQNRQHARHVP